MDYKEYNNFLHFGSVRQYKFKKQQKEDYETLDEGMREIKVVLIILAIFSLVVVNWGNQIINCLGL